MAYDYYENFKGERVLEAFIRGAAEAKIKEIRKFYNNVKDKLTENELLILLTEEANKAARHIRGFIWDSYIYEEYEEDWIFENEQGDEGFNSQVSLFIMDTLDDYLTPYIIRLLGKNYSLERIYAGCDDYKLVFSDKFLEELFNKITGDDYTTSC